MAQSIQRIMNTYVSMGCLVLYGVLNGWYLYLATQPSFVHHILGMAVYVYSAMAGLVYLVVGWGNMTVKADMLKCTVVVKMCILLYTKFTTTLTLLDWLTVFRSFETACTLLLILYAASFQSKLL